MILLRTFPNKPVCDKTEVVIKCVEDPSVVITSGLESVQTVITRPRGHSKVPSLCHYRIAPIKSENLHLSKVERVRHVTCVFNYRRDIEKSLREFYIDNQELIRRTHHKYLTSESIIIEVGGNNGDDASAMIEMYRPYKYIVLEPMKLLFIKLKERLKGNKNVMLYNFGLGALNGIFHVNIPGNQGAGASLFKTSSLKGTCSLEVVNATSFFLLLGVGCFEVDLLTINCEGCEFDVLETILTSNLINYFRHIQYATHSTLESVADPVERYCKIQEKLARTHRLAYQFRFVWETWQRKDIVHT